MFVIIIITACLLITIVFQPVTKSNAITINQWGKTKQESRPTSGEGTFHLENTTEEKELCGIVGSYPLVGETWNLTIQVAANSSTGINVSFYGHYVYNMSWWDGAKAFQVEPGTTHSEIYLSHFTCDFPAFPSFNIALQDSTKQASGSYWLEKIEKGYLIDVGTGDTYIANITAWLNEMTTSSSKTHLSSSSTTSPTTTSAVKWPVVLLVVILTAILRVTRRKLSQ
jgi:hypothetical protein